MADRLNRREGFGTSPVFFTAICTILGAILFLRLGFATGNLGLLGTVWMIILGHLVTIPTAMSIAEIATNQRVEGGREYYIISRSFGTAVGGAIGLALYFSQAVSVAFYVVAFAEAFRPFFDLLLASDYNIYVYDYRLVSILAILILTLFTLSQNRRVGVRMIYLVAGILVVAIILFLTGTPKNGNDFSVYDLGQRVDDPADFFYIFAIIFPAFTGMTAGVGLSSDLKNPSKSIPKGTIYATVAGLVIYIIVAIKLYYSASVAELNGNEFVMSDIAVWGPIIPLGLAAATITSAIGSFLVAPRTLQAIAADRVLPSSPANFWLGKLSRLKREPKNATIITAIIALFFVFIGDVNTIAQIVTICFLITYGGICSVSFLEHFTADPTYRPAFRSRWYISLIGAVVSLYLIFRIYHNYAILSLILIFLIYYAIDRFNKEKSGISAIFQGFIFQLNRELQVFLQKSKKDPKGEHWRPSIVCISERTFEKFAAFDLLRWISHKYGFGTYIHRIDGYLSTETNLLSQEYLNRMINMAEDSNSNVYLDTLVSPSFTAAISSVIQLPGMSGKENNTMLFEFDKNNPDKELANIMDNFTLVRSVGFDICILASSTRSFGYKSKIDIYLTSNDIDNANLMILLGFVILGHPEWKGARIRLLAVHPVDEIAEQRERILALVESGRLPISRNNVELIAKENDTDVKSIINEKSKDACLTIIGIRTELVKHKKKEIFLGYEEIGDILFVNAKTQKEIS
ncbi:MAG: amino acid transporter [Flammeovirgaceae bacterium]|jgi:amino acid transporter